MDHFDQEKYDSAEKTARQLFQDNPRIHSAAVGSVKLNSDGFLHLIFKNPKHKRDCKNRMKRFELLRYLKDVLAGMSHYQEYFETKQAIRIKRQGTILLESRVIRYWGFIAVIKDKIRIKIILKKVGDGNIIFWSIIPFWKTKNYKNISIVNLSTGNIEDD
jgi:hypothetical protein